MRSKLAISLSVMLVLFLVALSIFLLKSKPDFKFDEIQCIQYYADFRLQRQNATLLTIFRIHNHTSKTFSLKSIRSSCSCMSNSDIPSILKPAESYTISVAMKTGDADGHLRQSLDLTFSDSEYDIVYNFVLSAEVRNDLSVNPKEVVVSASPNQAISPIEVSIKQFGENNHEKLDIVLPELFKVQEKAILPVEKIDSKSFRLLQHESYRMSVHNHADRLGLYSGDMQIVSPTRGVIAVIPYRINFRTSYSILPNKVTFLDLSRLTKRFQIRFHDIGDSHFHDLTFKTSPEGLIESTSIASTAANYAIFDIKFYRPEKSLKDAKLFVKNGDTLVGTVELGY